MSNNKIRSNKPKKPINKETNNEILDTELKDDYMDLIKAQNKKIQGLFSEIEKKDKLLSQFQIQLKAFEEIKVENNFLKSQISILTEDFNKKSNSLKNFYEKKIKENLEELKEKEQINAELLNDLENIKKLLNENKQKFELIQKGNLTNIEKVNKSLNSERDYESKAKELVNIIQSQDSEIKKYNEYIKELNNNINEAKKNNDELIKENEELKKQNNEHENVMINMNSAIEDLKIKLKKQENKKDNISKTHQISMIKIKELEKEIKSLKTQNNGLIKINNQSLLYPKAIFDTLNYFKTVISGLRLISNLI